VKDSACVVQEGAVADCVFIITHGELRPVVTDEYNVPHHMATFKPGSMLGEAAFLTQQHLRSASLIAVGDTQLYSLPYTILEQLSEESDHFQKIMLEQQQIHKPERLLEQTSFFCNYSPEVRREIAQQMEPVTLKSGDVLFDCNERSHLDLYVVQSGLVSMAAHKDGREKYLNTAKTGDTVGELGVPHNMRKLRAHAVADAVLMRWPEVFYRSFYMHNAAIRQELLERQENFQKKTR
jgi:CRP-like cAMP-binding protein